MNSLKSPVGSRQPLHPVQLEDGLTAYRCPESGGHYIPAIAYMNWLNRQPARLPQLPPAEDAPSEIQRSGAALLCPETGTIMARFKVGHGFHFTIDRSVTGGVWLGPGEWEALRSRNFHDEIHFIFSEPWQRNILREEISSSARKRLEDRIGAELLSKLDALKEELAENAHRDEIIAYLTKS